MAFSGWGRSGFASQGHGCTPVFGGWCRMGRVVRRSGRGRTVRARRVGGSWSRHRPRWSAVPVHHSRGEREVGEARREHARAARRVPPVRCHGVSRGRANFAIATSSPAKRGIQAVRARIHPAVSGAVVRPGISPKYEAGTAAGEQGRLVPAQDRHRGQVDDHDRGPQGGRRSSRASRSHGRIAAPDWAAASADQQGGRVGVGAGRAGHATIDAG